MRARMAATVTAASALVSVVGTGAALAAPAPAAAVKAASASDRSSLTLTSTGASTLDDIFTPLAGSADTLIMSQQHRYSRDVNESASADPPYASAPVVIYARTGTGQMQRIGNRPGAAEDFSFSLAGATLAAAKRVDDDTPVTNEAYAWDTATGKRTEIDLPADGVYLAAAPDGVLFAKSDGTLAIRKTSGASISLGKPFGTTTRESIISAAVDASGAVVTDATGDIAFVSFTKPYTVTALQNPTPGQPMVCDQVDDGWAACAVAVYDGDVGAYDPSQPVVEPLDGSAPTVDTTSGCDDPFLLAISGSTEVWTCPSFKPTGGATYVLDSLAAGATASVTSSTACYFALTSAYDEVIGADPAQDSLFAATSATNASTQVPPEPSPVTVDAFAMTPSKILYTDDEPVTSRPGQIESALERTVDAKKSSVHANTPKLVDPQATGVTGNLVGLSKSLRVVATTGGVKHEFTEAVLHVHSHFGDVTIDDAIGQGVIQVSGHRLLYQRPSRTGSDEVVYDAKAGKTTVVRKVGGIDYTGIALSGHFVAYANHHAAIYRENLSTGKKKLIRKALPADAGGVEIDVYAHGHWVGWHALPVQGELAHRLDQIRNAKTMAPAISLPHTLFSLTSAGAILDSTQATFRTGFSEADQVTTPSKFWLRSYTGHTRALLPKASYLAGPEIAGHLLAYGDADGVLRLERLGSH